MKVIHITPTYFSNASFLIGGGERYVTELASCMASFVDTTLVSFSSKRSSYHQGDLKFEIYPVNYFIRDKKVNPLSLRYLGSILDADIVHIHNINTLISDQGCLVASLLGKRVFVTDYGGGADFVLNRKLPVFQLYKNAIIYSKYSFDFLPEELQKVSRLIKGGIDTKRFCPSSFLEKEKKVLFVGRILPHKGINYLIEAFRLLNFPDYKLTIVGKVYNERFYQDLKQLAVGLPVEFIHDADDDRLLHEYRTALVTVLPSVHTTCYGDYTSVPELMGFTLLESQACGTPVICTDAGAMHEFVDHGKTGFIVKQNSGESIANALQRLISLSSLERAEFSSRCQAWIESMGWTNIVQKHLEVYRL